MFMTGQELRNRIEQSGDKKTDESLNDMWERKVTEAKSGPSVHGGGVYDSIKREGLHDGTMIRLSHQPTGSMVIDAHHRIAAAADLEASGDKQVYFPVTHYPGNYDDFLEMRFSSYKRNAPPPGSLL